MSERSKGPPYDLDAEAAVLSAILLGGRSVAEVIELAPDDFSRGHGYVFEAIRCVLARGETPDVVTVAEVLKARGRLVEIGGVPGLAELLDKAPAIDASRAKAYARIVGDRARERGLLAVLERNAARLRTGVDEPATFYAELDRELRDVVPDEARSGVSARLSSGWAPLGEAVPDALTAKPAEPRWLLRRERGPKGRGVLRAGKVGLLVAAGGVGKTQALVQLAVAVATGDWWLGAFHVEEPGKVLLALAEEDADEMHRRLHHAVSLAGVDERGRLAVLERVVALPLAGSPVGLVEHDRSGNVKTTATLDLLRRRLTEHGPWRLVVLDPLSRWAGSDTESDNAAATAFVQAVETLTEAPGTPTVLVAHHTPKATRGVRGAASARGVSALSDGVRWVATLEHVDDDDSRSRASFEAVELRIVKSNYAPRGEPVVVVRDTRHGGALRPMLPNERATFESAGGPMTVPTPSANAARGYDEE